ncbi:MAG: SDR family oxidoreductase [Ktedonobacteraceae bacterium]|nr:SDR family oxidoreductase [Ktedonobacteraceae bacterium]
MRLTVFGASGRTGRPLVQQALDAGHDVVAFVRDPAKLPLQHERLTVVQGDVMKLTDVEKAVEGSDTVLSTVGQSKGSPKDLQTVATRNIVAAMEKYGVKRLVSLTGAGVDAPEDQPKLINNIIKFALKTLSGAVLQDALGHVDVIKGSNLDWVIVRGPRLTEGPHTGKYRVGWVGVNTGTSISRADLAGFMLKEVTDNTYLHKLPMVSD